MKKTILLFFLAAAAVQSCKKERPRPLTKDEIAAQVDSIVRQRIKQVEDDAKKELEYRMKIEVKIKADSLVRVMLLKKDSLNKEAPTKKPL